MAATAKTAGEGVWATEEGRMTTPQPLEKEILNQCLQYLNARGVFCWRANSGGSHHTNADGTGRYVAFNHQKGISDIIGMLRDGTFLAIETKREGGKLSPDQRTFLDAVRLSGGVGLCVHSVDELITELDRILQ